MTLTATSIFSTVRQRRRSLCLGLLILLAAVLAYIPLCKAGYIWDDPDYVVNNLDLRDLGGLGRIWFDPASLPQYYPLVHTTFWVEYHLWGLHPLGYHLDNLLLHALGAFLLWRLLLKLGVPCAYLGAMIWALHPVNVESVAWITERKNVLSGVFYFSSFITYLDWRERSGGLGDQAAWRGWAVAFVLFAAALLSKTVTASLPAAVLVVLWWKRGRIAWRDVWPLIPFFVIGALAGSYTAYLERYHVGAMGKEWDFTFIDRVLIAGRALWFYLGKVFWPVNLSFIYPRWHINRHEYWQYVFPMAGVAVVGVLFLLRKRLGRGPLAAALLFGGTLFPALGFSNIYPMRYSFVADHFQYLASVAVIVPIAATLGCRLRRWMGHFVFVLLVPLAALTFMRAGVYKDALTLWTDTLRRNPNSFMVHFNYAEALLDLSKREPARKKELEEEARRQRFRAMELAPQLPETHWNVGVDYAMQNQPDKAMGEFRRTLALDPNYAPAYDSIGKLYLEKNELDRAYENFAKAAQLQPGYAEAQFNAGVALEKKGDVAGAIRRYIQALAGKRDYVDAHYNLANCLMRIGRLPEAVGEYEQALRYKPDKVEALTNLGAALLRLDRPAEAAGQFQAALRLKPGLSPAQHGLEVARRLMAR